MLKKYLRKQIRLKSREWPLGYLLLIGMASPSIFYSGAGNEICTRAKTLAMSRTTAILYPRFYHSTAFVVFFQVLKNKFAGDFDIIPAILESSLLMTGYLSIHNKRHKITAWLGDVL